MTLLLDTHVVQWWSAEQQRLTPRARAAIDTADELAVASITWYELAWLVEHDRISIQVPLRTWLDGLAEGLETIPLTPAIAAIAAALPDSFPGDPSDRIIYATAIETGCQLVTSDRRLREHLHARPIAVW